MDSLRATNLSSILTDNKNNKMNNNNNNNSTNKLDKDNVSRLVKTFGELSKHEKILFLINIREFTRDTNNTSVKGIPVTTTTIPDLNNSAICNGIKQDPDSMLSLSSTPPSSSSSPVSTPQSLRLSRTSNWLQKTFIQDTQVALPKEEVYGLYKSEFQRVNEKPISTADFGKLMRQVFPDVKARRLGQRGQSKYCYANIRKRSDVEKPALPNPLPQNELITWAKNKFNIDFSEVSQVVAYLKSENNIAGGGGRKRRASCGGALLNKQRGNNNSTTGGGGSGGKGGVRSASVSVLELDQNKDDPLASVLHDNESLEIGSYFENSIGGDGSSTTTTTTNWPQLRSLLTEDSNSFGSSCFTKKKRHSSSVQFEFIKPELHGPALLHRSQSVPVTEMSFIRSTTLDELQSTSTSSIFDELNVHATNNPLFSSAATNVELNPHHQRNAVSTSSCSSNSSGLFESIDVSAASGGGGGGGSSENDSTLLLNGSNGGSSVVGNDVFFDSVFDLMMSDCQN